MIYKIKNPEKKNIKNQKHYRKTQKKIKFFEKNDTRNKNKITRHKEVKLPTPCDFFILKMSFTKRERQLRNILIFW